MTTTRPHPTQTLHRVLVVGQDDLWRHICHENIAKGGWQARSYRNVAEIPADELAAADYVLGGTCEALDVDNFLEALRGRGWDGPIGTIGPASTLRNRRPGVHRISEYEVIHLPRRIEEHLGGHRWQRNQPRRIVDVPKPLITVRTPPIPGERRGAA